MALTFTFAYQLIDAHFFISLSAALLSKYVDTYVL
ncbi:MAG: hypothetical protein ACI9ES_002425, partial [Oceanospirillaceae bacterium]